MRSNEKLALQNIWRLSISKVDMAFAGAGAPVQGESGGDRGEITFQAGHKVMQFREVVS